MAQANQLMPGEWEVQDLGTYASQYKQDKENIYLKEAIAMGNMDPRAAEGYYKGKLDRSITNGILSLFGGQAADPELRKANDLDAIFKSLSEEDIKDPASALNKVADELAARGHTKEAITYRMKASNLADEFVTKKTKSKLDTLKAKTEAAKYIGSQANGILESMKTLGKDNPKIQQELWEQYAKINEDVLGKEEADKLRALPSTAWTAKLQGDKNASETAATSSMEERQLLSIAAAKDNALIRAAAVVEGASKRALAQMSKTDKELAFKYSNLTFRKSIAARKDIEARVNAGDSQVKQLGNDIEQISQSIDGFRSKINFAGEDKETVQANINSLEAKLASVRADKAAVEAQNATFRQQFNDVISANTQAYNPTPGAVPSLDPAKRSVAHAEYVTKWNAAKGNPAEQARLTALARKLGVAK
jgi:chromosome segregation ATPase